MSTLTTADVYAELDRLSIESRPLSEDSDLAGYVLDPDGWIVDDEPGYQDPAEVIAIQAQQLANVRHALRRGTLTANDRTALEDEQATLCFSIRDELARAELVVE